MAMTHTLLKFWGNGRSIGSIAVDHDDSLIDPASPAYDPVGVGVLAYNSIGEVFASATVPDLVLIQNLEGTNIGQVEGITNAQNLNHTQLMSRTRNAIDTITLFGQPLDMAAIRARI